MKKLGCRFISQGTATNPKSNSFNDSIFRNSSSISKDNKEAEESDVYLIYGAR